MRFIHLMIGVALTTLLVGCVGMYPNRHHEHSSSLVDFLYGSKEVPPVDAEVRLQLPIRVGLGFLPSSGDSEPTAIERAKVLAEIRDNFKSLRYVSEIVPIPDYYLRTDRRDGQSSGLAQIEQLSRLYRLDLFALVSYDQITDSSSNAASLAYWTIVGAYIVPADRNETHTLIDLAVIDPRTRSLVLRSGGTSALHGHTPGMDVERHGTAQRSKGFELATASLVDNFARELVDFEARVKEGTATVKVVSNASGGGGGGGGAMDPLLLLFLAALGAQVAWRWRKARAVSTVQSRGGSTCAHMRDVRSHA